LAPIDALKGDASARLWTRAPVARTVAAVRIGRKRYIILILLGSDPSDTEVNAARIRVVPLVN
jgi:hypothetical protein